LDNRNQFSDLPLKNAM